MLSIFIPWNPRNFRYIHNLNSAGPFRGKKATLWEGGIRVPAILEWPDRFKQHHIINTPCSTSDFYPTLLKITGTQVKNQPLLDGIDIMPILAGQTNKRSSPIAFQAPVMSKKDVLAEQGTKQLCLHDNRYKLISVNGGKKWMFFDMIKDPAKPLISGTGIQNESNQWQSNWNNSLLRVPVAQREKIIIKVVK